MAKPKREASNRTPRVPADPNNPARVELREKAFTMRLDRASLRDIAKALHCNKDTAKILVDEELAIRAEERKAQRETDKEDSISFYEAVQKRALDQHDTELSILKKIDSGARENAKVSTHALSDGIRAQERIDKIKGIDAPTKLDLGLQDLLGALDDESDPPASETK